MNQAITYALCYGTDRAVLVHQSKPGGAKGVIPLGTIRGIRLDAYAFDLGAENLEAEETAFADRMFDLVRSPQSSLVAA
jgi:5-methylcytosine-specific restriction enzyme subunit McrC